MNSRQRQIAVLNRQLPDRIPVDSICVENTDKIAQELGIPIETVLDRLGLDGQIVGPGYTGAPRMADDGTPLTIWGTAGGDYGTAYWHPLGVDATVADVERVVWPDPAHFDYAGFAASTKQLAVKYATRGPYWVPLFCTVCDLFGMETALMKMATEEDVFEAAVQGVFERVYGICERMIDAAGDDLDILCLGDDFATQRGLMISPEHWRRFLKPWYAKLFGLGKAKGKFVWFHSCGDVTAVLPDLIEAGMDVWETVQLHTLPMSAEDLKREFGRDVVFFGGVSTQRLPFASPESVREETLRCIDVLGKGGGYICGPDHHIKPDVSVANTLALFDTATGFRREGYTA
jgi:uroporphyrinogen decarboxylase